MRFFAAIAVTALGIGCYAVAALLFDRRRQVAQWMRERHAVARPPARAGASTPRGYAPAQIGARVVRRTAQAGAGMDAAIRTVTAANPHNPVLVPLVGCLLLGTLLIFGSCVGLIAF